MIPTLLRTGSRAARLAALSCIIAGSLVAVTEAQAQRPAAGQAQRAASAQQTQQAQKPASGQAQALLLETAGKWQAFSSQQGRSKVCYALAKAESRSPANLKDVEGMVFVSNRPAEGVRNEISFVMNFDLKEDVEHHAVVGSERFTLVAKGQNMWLKNPAEEPRMLDALRKGSSLEIKATSKRGNATSDKYSLAGMSQTVKRAEDACK